MLALVFLWSGAAKIARRSAWIDALRGYRLPRPVAAVAAPGVVVAEWSIAALLVAGATRVGSALALAMLSAFSLAILRARALQGDRLPCGCFGGSDGRDYRAMIARNVILGGAAASMLVADRDLAVFEGMRVPRPSELVPAGLIVVAAIVAVWMLLQVFASSRRGQP
jgi:uncharacterized membrane protein YphA (DoxX/SURF4 family)